MIDLNTFRENARLDGLCGEYTAIWDGCISKKDYMDMALNVKGLDYLGDSIAKGWGLSPEYIHKKFSNYINGRYIYEGKGYDTEMYCQYSGDVFCRTTAILLIECDVTLHVFNGVVMEVYCTGKCNVKIKGNGNVAVIAYGRPEDVVCESGDMIRMRRIQKKEKARYR